MKYYLTISLSTTVCDFNKEASKLTYCFVISRCNEAKGVLGLCSSGQHSLSFSN